MRKTIKNILVIIGYFGIVFTIYSFFTNPIIQLKDAEIGLLKSQRDDCREKLNIERQASDNLRRGLQKKGSVVTKPKNVILEPTEIQSGDGVNLLDGQVVISYSAAQLNRQGNRMTIVGSTPRETYYISEGQQYSFTYKNKEYVLNVLGIYTKKDTTAIDNVKYMAKISVCRKEEG